MTVEQRAKLREAIENSTDLEGGELCLDGEGMNVEKGKYTIAYFPYDLQPMSEEDEKYNQEVRFNAWLFLSCRSNQTELLADLEEAEKGAEKERERMVGILEWRLREAKQAAERRHEVGQPKHARYYEQLQGELEIILAHIAQGTKAEDLPV